MSKKNLPNIPIYIGDWERDCNVLSLESEAAWMRIVFKLWTKGKQNAIKIPAKSLQNLWRCSAQKMQEILEELIYNEIAEIQVDERFIQFTCRRFVKENEISKKRSDAAKSKQKKETNTKQKSSKTQAKHKQITENDNDNEIDNEIIESKNEKIGFQILHVEDWLKKAKSQKEQVWREVFLVNQKVSSDDELKKYLIRFKDFCIEQGKDYREYNEFKSHFSNILPKWTQEIKNTEQVTAGRR